jgi:hypothetical protein
VLVWLRSEREPWKSEGVLDESDDRLGRTTPLFRFLDEHPTALLTALYPRLAESHRAGRNWKVALPPERSLPTHRLSALHHIAVESSTEREQLEAALRKDPLVASFRQPVLQYPIEPAPDESAPLPDLQWALTTCGFRDVWPVLDVGPDPGPIAVLDQGGDPGHPELDTRLTVRAVSRSTAPADGSHAAEVCAVMAARRNDGAGMEGCCSARIDLYNACGPNGQPDSVAYSSALAELAERALTGSAGTKPQVLYLGLGSTIPDPDIAKQLVHLMTLGIVVVVPMGNEGGRKSPVRFPSAVEGVIAVGATNPDGLRPNWASKGDHMFICAPGTQIRTIKGKNDFSTPNGTSYSAAIVTAAVWLMRRRRPCLTVAQVRDILQTSVETTFTGGLRTQGLGYGRLDMVKLSLNLVNVTCPPDS